MTMRVRRLSLDDTAGRARWDAWVRTAPPEAGASFFHLSGWSAAVARVFGHRLHSLWAEDDAGRVRGVLPLAHVHSTLFGNALVSLPFAVYAGVAADDDGAARALEAEADATARRLGVDHLELRHVAPRHAGDARWPTQDLYVTFRKPIAADDETNLQAIPRKQRAMVRKSIARGLSFEIDAGVGRFFDVYADNVLRHGTPALPRSWFEALADEFGRDCEVLSVLAPDGRAVSSVMSFYFRRELLAYYAGDRPEARELAANDFKYWSLMRRAAERGVEVFDYGRSKLGTGPYAFKKNWGFEPTPLHYEHRLYRRDALPQNNPNNPKYRLMIEAWKRLPLGVANRLGPRLVRSLG